MNIIDFIKVLLSPSYWILSYPINKSWDKELQDMLSDSDKKWKFIDDFTCELNGIKIWIANHPYGSCRPYTLGINEVKNFLPSRRTMMLFEKEFENYFREKLRKDRL